MTVSGIRQSNNEISTKIDPSTWFAYTCSQTEHGRRYQNLTHELATFSVWGPAAIVISLFQKILIQKILINGYFDQGGDLFGLYKCSGKLEEYISAGDKLVEYISAGDGTIDFKKTCKLRPVALLALFALPIALGCGISAIYYYKGATKKYLGQVIDVPTQEFATLQR